MTTNSKIGLGVGMVAVFATFVIGMYGMQSSKVASVGSYNNSAAALKSSTAESAIMTVASENKDMNAAGRLTTLPVSNSASCAQVTATTLPLTTTSFNDGDSTRDVAKLRIKNNGTCNFYLTYISLANLSYTGSWNFAKIHIFDASTGQVIPTSTDGKNTFMNDTSLYFGGGANGAVVMKILAPSQQLDVIVRADYIRNTFLLESPQVLPGPVGIKDYFSIGINAIGGYDANMALPGMNITQRFDKVMSVQ